MRHYYSKLQSQDCSTSFHFDTKRNGFIQVLPLILLAAFAITTLVIANRVQTQQEEIRSRAATSPGCAYYSQSQQLIYHADGSRTVELGCCNVTNKCQTTTTTPALTTCSGFINCVSGYHRECKSPPNWSCVKDAAPATTSAPKPVTTTTVAPKPTTCSLGPVSCGTEYNRVCTNPPFWSCVPAPAPTQYYILNRTTRICDKISAYRSDALTITECTKRLAALPIPTAPPVTTTTVAPSGCTLGPVSCGTGFNRVCDIGSGFFTCVAAIPTGMTLADNALCFPNGAISQCNQCSSGNKYLASDGWHCAPSGVFSPACNTLGAGNCLPGQAYRCVANIGGSWQLRHDDSCNRGTTTAQTAAPGVNEFTSCIKQCRGNLVCIWQQCYRRAVPPTPVPQITEGQSCDWKANELRQGFYCCSGKTQGFLCEAAAVTGSSCTEAQSVAGFCNDKGEKCKKLSQQVGPNHTPVFVYHFEADTSCTQVAVTTPAQSREIYTLVQGSDYMWSCVRGQSSGTQITATAQECASYANSLNNQQADRFKLTEVVVGGVKDWSCIPDQMGGLSFSECTRVRNTLRSQTQAQPQAQTGGTVQRTSGTVWIANPDRNGCKAVTVSPAAPITGYSDQKSCEVAFPPAPTQPPTAPATSTQAAKPAPATASINKQDITGAVNPSCCTFSSDCPRGQTCDVRNEYCKSGFSCRPPAPPPAPQVTATSTVSCLSNTAKAVKDAIATGGGVCAGDGYDCCYLCPPGSAKSSSAGFTSCYVGKEGAALPPPPTGGHITPSTAGGPKIGDACRSLFDPLSSDCGSCPGGLHHWSGARQFCGPEQPSSYAACLQLASNTTSGYVRTDCDMLFPQRATAQPPAPTVGCLSSTADAVKSALGQIGNVCASAGNYNCCSLCPSSWTLSQSGGFTTCDPPTATIPKNTQDACYGKSPGECSPNQKLCAIFRGIVYETAQKCPSAVVTTQIACSDTQKALRSRPGALCKEGSIDCCSFCVNGSTPLTEGRAACKQAFEAPVGGQAACASGWQCSNNYTNVCASAQVVSDFTAVYCDPKSQWLYQAGNNLGVNCGGRASRLKSEGCDAARAVGNPCHLVPYLIGAIWPSCELCPQELSHWTNGMTYCGPGPTAVVAPEAGVYSPCDPSTILFETRPPKGATLCQTSDGTIRSQCQPPAYIYDGVKDLNNCLCATGYTKNEKGECVIPTAVPAKTGQGPEARFTAPPKARDVAPPDSARLNNGKGMSDGTPMNDGNIQVEKYCESQGLTPQEDNATWSCLNATDKTVKFTLTWSDFDAICRQTYGNSYAFAIGDGGTDRPSRNIRCYGYTGAAAPAAAVGTTALTTQKVLNVLCTVWPFNRLTLCQSTGAAVVPVTTPPVSSEVPAGVQPKTGAGAGVPSVPSGQAGTGVRGRPRPKVTPTPPPSQGACRARFATASATSPVGWCDALGVRCLVTDKFSTRSGQFITVQLPDPWCDFEGLPASTCTATDQRGTAVDATGQTIACIRHPLPDDTPGRCGDLTCDRPVENWETCATDCSYGLKPPPPVDQRSVAPAGSSLLPTGIGLTNGAVQVQGNFQVEGYCPRVSAGVFRVSRTDADWFCSKPDGSQRKLGPLDFDVICRRTYKNPGTFAIQNGTNTISAFNWRCYEFPKQ